MILRLLDALGWSTGVWTYIDFGLAFTALSLFYNAGKDTTQKTGKLAWGITAGSLAALVNLTLQQVAAIVLAIEAPSWFHAFTSYALPSTMTDILTHSSFHLSLIYAALGNAVLGALLGLGGAFVMRRRMKMERVQLHPS